MNISLTDSATSENYPDINYSKYGKTCKSQITQGSHTMWAIWLVPKPVCLLNKIAFSIGLYACSLFAAAVGSVS